MEETNNYEEKAAEKVEEGQPIDLCAMFLRVAPRDASFLRAPFGFCALFLRVAPRDAQNLRALFWWPAERWGGRGGGTSARRVDASRANLRGSRTKFIHEPLKESIWIPEIIESNYVMESK